MSCMSCEEAIREFYNFALRQGLEKSRFLSEDNIDQYVATSVDAYRDYPLFLFVFDGNYDEKTLSHMMSVDFRSRVNMTAGIACGDGYESVMLIEPPNAEEVGLGQYIKGAKPADFALLLKSAIYRQEKYESFARKERLDYLDEKTWYIYLFATKKDFQKSGYGKKLMRAICSFADDRDYRICLETDLEKNVSMYEHFGFELMKSSEYRNSLQHFVLLYGA